MSDTYKKDDADRAPLGHLPIVDTNLEVVCYAINERDLCLLVNKAGVCIYRATLVQALDPDLEPLSTPIPFIDDTFVVRDLAAARAELERVLAEGGSISRGVSYSTTVGSYRPDKK